jgi:hypothetical protein
LNTTNPGRSQPKKIGLAYDTWAQQRATTSTAARAGANQRLITYDFKSKEELWRAVTFPVGPPAVRNRQIARFLPVILPMPEY